MPLLLPAAFTMLPCCRFGAHRGNYMFHCHNLVHEDHDMMRAYVTVGGAGQDNLPVLNPATTLLVNEAAGVCC
jgi:hypothetical protein